MKIFAALKQIEFALKLFANAGFTSFDSAFAAKNEDALREHLAQQVKIVEKDVEPTQEQLGALAVAELRAQIVASGIALKADEDPIAALKAGYAEYNAVRGRLSLLETELTACGIKLVAADPKAGLVASDIKKAVDDRISLKAAELTATIGTRPLENKITNDLAAAARQSKTEGLTGLARVRAALASGRN